MATRDVVDVVVVGAGAAGSLLAAKLAQSGKRVVVLESGPDRKVQDLISSQIWARRLKWAGTPVFGSGPFPIDNNFNAGFGFGGSALHHYACWFRLHPEDFRVATVHGRDLDWPLTYDELRPFYDEIQREVGISGDARAEVWRPPGDPYPMPPLPNFAQGQLIKRGFATLGIRTSPTPHAINSVPYRGRAACLNEGWCDAGCPVGALANPLNVYLPQAAKARATLRPWSYVTRILTDSSGKRAVGVEYRDRDGKAHVQRASVVIIAAFAVQTPRLLLNSSSPKHPLGLANRNGAVGTHMMVHVSGTVYGLFKEETEPYLGVSGGSLLSQDAYEKIGHPSYFGSRQWLAALAMKPNDLLGIAMARTDLFGKDLQRFMRDASHHIASMTLLGEDHPRPENRVTLSSKTDQHGVPLAATTHAFTNDTLTLYDVAMREGLAVFRAAGAREVWHGPMIQQHILGGTIMGAKTSTSVTNSYGQTHEVENLFIAGTGLFPTTGAVNPTYTLHALALRTSRYILSSWNSLKSSA